VSSAAPTATAPERRTPWRDNIEAMTVAIIMAVVLKYFIVEAYKIPTGSMQPTLMGNERTGIFDRILVDKLSFHFRDPERFEVVIFKYPLDRAKNFVKRLVGMPGEFFRIAFGDLWTRPDEESAWKVLRRPRPVQRATWKRLDQIAAGPEGSCWRAVEGSWKLSAKRASGSGRLRLGTSSGTIRDDYTDGYPKAMREAIRASREVPPTSGTNPVGDLRVAGEVRASPGCQSITVAFDEGERRYRLTLPGPASPPDAVPTIRVESSGAAYEGPSEARGEPFRLREGRRIDFSAQNLDDLLELEVDGEVVCSLEVHPAADQRSAAWIEVAGAEAELFDLVAYRDIYYTDDGQETELYIDEGHYFMLGDNTQNSSDSRQWTWHRVRLNLPDGEEQILRGNLVQDPANPTNNNPMAFHPSDGGSYLRFRDEWGESWFLPVESQERLPPQTAPLVPRELITGRALLVFWPMAPLKKLFRLKWIR
jgi:signal peptidase I